jgi:uncharacterized protein YjgD (DUF1641 family)
MKKMIRILNQSLASEHEILKEAENLLEHLEIAELIDKRLKKQKRSQNIPWEKVKAKHGIRITFKI